MEAPQFHGLVALHPRSVIGELPRTVLITLDITTHKVTKQARRIGIDQDDWRGQPGPLLVYELPRDHISRMNVRGIEQLRAAFNLDRRQSDAIHIDESSPSPETRILLALQCNDSRWSTDWDGGGVVPEV